MLQPVTYNLKPNPLAVYIHWPFCKKKCPYCDFNSHVPQSAPEMDRWAQAYHTEIAYFAAQLPGRTITSIFFGGGTPSLMQPSLVADILAALAAAWPVAPTVEITLEANPTSIEMGKFRAFRNAGVNRVSIGVQSLNPDDLTFLGREHSPNDALRALDIAANIFDRFSFDLIYARPGQTLESWQAELTRALPYARGHLSLYQLTIEKGTPFYSAYQKHQFQLPDDDTAADLYQLTTDMLAAQDMHAYEVSNYATPSQECRHNLAYWQYQEYVGIGPGAHGRIQCDETAARTATMTWHAPETWLNHVQQHGHGIQSRTLLSPSDIAAEVMMMGLRLKDGIDIHERSQRLGIDLNTHLNAEKIRLYCDETLLVQEGSTLRATDSGRMVLGKLTSEILKIDYFI